MKRLFLFSLILLFVSGCTSFNEATQFSEKNYSLKFIYNYSDPSSDNYFYTAFNNAQDKKSERNQIIFEMLRIVDVNYYQYERHLRAKLGSKNFSFKTLSILLTGGAAVSGEAAANSLSAVDTALKGINESVDTEFFRNNGSELIMSKIRSTKSAALIDIYDKMNKTIEQYPLPAALRDIENYRNLGSVTSALVALSAATAEEEKKNTRDASIKEKLIQ